MADNKNIRLNKVLKELNISLDRAVEFLGSKGIEVEKRPTTKISQTEHDVLLGEFDADRSRREASREVNIGRQRKEKAEEEARAEEKATQEAAIEAKRLAEEKAAQEAAEAKRLAEEKAAQAAIEAKRLAEEKAAQEAAEAKRLAEEKVKKAPKIIGKIDVDATKKAPKKKENIAPASKKVEKTEKVQKEQPKKEQPKKEKEVEERKEPIEHKTEYKKIAGISKTGQTIDLSKFEKPKKKPADKGTNANKKRRKRIRKDGTPATGTGANKSQGGNNANRSGGGKGRFNKRRPAPVQRVEPTEEEIKKQVRETLEKLQGKGKKNKKGAKHRREKRDLHKQKVDKELEQQSAEEKILKVTEFVTVSEVATMMDVPVVQIISACMSLGMIVTMNQRLDAETLSIVAEEFGFDVEFVSEDTEDTLEEIEDTEEDLLPRVPIVTVMGHVDHGKTSLLDYVRETNVIAGESGGITQHIGAYSVELKNGKRVTFLDTPGHEAFTAMRARGAQVTDIAIIVIAADDDVMPQTKEAISHAQAAGVPIVFAINKVDKSTANPDNIKTQLSAMDLLVEDWGGKIQSQEISAKTGQGIEDLMEKVLLEAEMLDLKANPNRAAIGTVVEAQLDKGRGYVSTVIVQKGTLKIGDYILAGKHHGKVKALFDERGKKVKEAVPSTPVSVLGLDGAAAAGDRFHVLKDEREAKKIASTRAQLMREQSVRTQKHLTLDEIGRRIALGDFKELNIVLKGDVSGSVEALTDALLKLSTDEIQVNIILKGVGQISESDVLLASASDAIIIGFNVRPSVKAKQLAEQEEIDIRSYSIVYDAINDVKDAMEGLLSPEIKEEITGTAEVRELFKISKVGTIAGCMVMNGKIFSKSKVRLIREGIVVYTGELAALKRFKDDAKEVSKGYDCGMQIKNYNDLQQMDVIEAYKEVEVKKVLK
jgi:translation initiation factor IF-2